MTSSRTSAVNVIVGVALGIVATFLTYDHQAGLGLSLYIVILLGALLAVARTRHIQAQRNTLLLLVPILFFTAMITIRAGESLLLMNLSAGIGLTLLMLYFFTSGNLLNQTIFEYPFKAVVASFDVWLRPLTELLSARHWLSERDTRWKSFLPVLRGLLITVPLVFVFVALLSSADEVFSRLVAHLLDGLLPRNLNILLTQTFFAGVFAWMAIGGLALAFADRKVKRAPTPEADEKARTPGPVFTPIRLGFTEAIMALGGVCLVFASFVAIQFVYLFGGQHNIANFSYAEYVHRGFTELVAVAVLTLGVVFTLNETTLRNTTRRENLFRGLSTLLIALTGVILVSAFQRMRLYELTYGFTTLRLQIYVFIVWLGIAFAGFTLSLYWKPAAINVFGVCALLSVIGFAATLDILNPDDFVTRQNIARGDIDPLYLSTLSIEAAPALVMLVDAPEPGLRQIVRQTLHDFTWELRGNRGILDFNLGSANAAAALDSVTTKIGENYDREFPRSHSLDEFKAFLKPGMTVREVVRQFGSPYSYSSMGSRSDDAFVLYYNRGNQQYIQLSFDSTTGLYRACTEDASAICLLPAP